MRILLVAATSIEVESLVRLWSREGGVFYNFNTLVFQYYNHFNIIKYMFV